MSREGLEPDPSAFVDCTAIVVTYNSAADLPGLLDTLPRAAPGMRVRALVVDNDSADDIESAIAGRPGVTLLRTGANLGYAGGINAGRKHLRGSLGPTRTVAILNPDLRLAPASLAWLIAAACRPAAGAAVPRFVEAGDEAATFPSLRREPSTTRVLGDALLGRRWAGRPGWLSEMVWDPRRYDAEGPADWATGAVLVVTAEADAAVGDWDESFFLYSEETDYSRRLREAGRTIQYVPDARVFHEGAGSGTGPALTALNEVNRVRYFRKYHGPAATAAFRVAVTLGQLLRIRRPGNRMALAALWSGRRRAELPGRPGSLTQAATADPEYAR
ncbi:glycosyltransferase family 2 protein [Rugosimonospora acidiphila]|uniref:Glycosyltransferase family 2 protein n=1 Tax=Rugosimonospora acidiphila TaxID=556531 RepID=A0ABP9RQX3_9ACTN